MEIKEVIMVILSIFSGVITSVITITIFLTNIKNNIINLEKEDTRLYKTIEDIRSLQNIEKDKLIVLDKVVYSLDQKLDAILDILNKSLKEKK